MLARLYIKNFALIEETSIEFGPGLNILTGETGAGKTIIMDALNLIIGSPTDAHLVRSGTDRCIVEGLFDFDPSDPAVEILQRLQAPLEDGQLALRREINSSGRSRAFLHGLSISLKRLREIGSVVVDLHGQHEHQSLLKREVHADFLDAFGNLITEAGAVRQLCRQLQEFDRDLKRLRSEEKNLIEEEELRRFQLEEIRSLAPAPGEDLELENNLRILENAESLSTTADQLYEQLYQADNSVSEQLGRARRQLDRILQTDPSLESEAEVMDSLRFGIEEIAESLRRYVQKLEPQPQESERIRDRLDALRRLKKKYGGDLEAALAFANSLEQQGQRYDSIQQELADREVDAAAATASFSKACQSLSSGRAGAAEALAVAVESNLAELGMAKTKFQVALTRPEEDWRGGERGMETVEFFLAANPGEASRPLNRVASGGELSRIMLVLKELLADNDTVPTLVFDEVDSGISGRVAAAVGKKLQNLSASHQALVITHLPQIASTAQTHFEVSKRSSGGRTITEVRELDASERAEALAHLLAGETVSETARKHAQEMLG